MTIGHCTTTQITVTPVDYSERICNLQCTAKQTSKQTKKPVENLHLQCKVNLVMNLNYCFAVFLDTDCTFKLRLAKNRTLEDLPGI